MFTEINNYLRQEAFGKADINSTVEVEEYKEYPKATFKVITLVRGLRMLFRRQGFPSVETDELILWHGSNGWFSSQVRDAFTSASASLKVSLEFSNNEYCCLYRILLPRGTTLLNLKSVSVFPKEDEFLLHSGMMMTERVISSYIVYKKKSYLKSLRELRPVLRGRGVVDNTYEVWIASDSDEMGYDSGSDEAKMGKDYEMDDDDETFMPEVKQQPDQALFVFHNGKGRILDLANVRMTRLTECKPLNPQKVFARLTREKKVLGEDVRSPS